MDESHCYVCQIAEDVVRLLKCPICFKRFCDKHSTEMSGRSFCSKGCAQYFFFGEPED